VASEATESAEPAEPKQSIWKKEISFGRKPKADAQAEPEPVPQAETVADAAEVVPDTSGPDPVSDTEPRPEEPVWQRAVTFSRKSEPEQPPAEAQQEAEAREEAPVSETAVPEPVATAPDTPHEEEAPEETAPAVPAAVEAETAPSDQVQVSDTGTRPDEPVWKKKASFSRKPAQEPPVIEQPTAEDAEEAPTAEAPAPPEPAPAAGQVVHPPVPAAELPPLPAEEKKVPFWKKEISLGKKRDATPKREDAPKEPKQQKEPKQRKEPKQPKQQKEPKPPKERKAKEPKVKVDRGSKGAKRLVGLKIGASQLAAARVANNGAAELLQVAREPLASGIVVGGELRDPDALSVALKEFFAKHNLPKRGVRLGIANNRIGVRTFDIAGIEDQKQLANAIRFRAQEALPIPIDEAVLDYQVLAEGVDEQGQPTRRVLLVVAYRELIDRYVEACRQAGITLVGIDLEAFALLRAVQAPQDGVGSDPNAALVAVAIGHERSTFAVSDGRVCEFTRVLDWGGAALNVALARVLDAAPSEVEDVKRSVSLVEATVPHGLNAEQGKKAVDAVRKSIQTFARELVSSLQYYQNQPGSLGIGEIVLTGGTAHLPGLAVELERLIGVRVRVGDPLARMRVSKKVGEPEQIGSLAVAIGLGIED
jgi:type IV pilus assembly protein PilM